MKALISYFLLICKKDKIFTSLLAMIFASFFVSKFFGWTMIDEISQAQIAYFAGSVRFLMIFGLTIFISFFISKFFASKELEFLCSTPKSRYEFVLSFMLCFAVIALFVALFVGFALAYFKTTSHIFSITGSLLWLASFVAEMLLICAFAIFISLSFVNPAVCILISLAFYLVCRSIGFITAAIYLSASQSSTIVFLPSSKILSSISIYFSKFIGVFFPRLDLLANSSWILYSSSDIQAIALAITQCLFYTVLIVLCSVKDLNKKQF